MYCENCGKENTNDARFCESCGAPLTNPEENVIPTEPAQSGNKGTMVVLGVLIIAVIAGLVWGGITLFGGNKLMKPMNNIIKAIEKEDADLFLEAIPEDLADALDRDDLKELEEGFKAGKEVLEDEYGKNVKIKAKVKSKEKLDEDDIKDLEEDTYFFGEDIDIDEAYEVEYKITVKGKDDKEEAEWETYVAKVDGKWCFIDMNGFIELIGEFLNINDIEEEMYGDGGYASAY